MTVVFIAAGLYHHISELTDALFQKYGSDFHFFATANQALDSVVIMGHESDMRSRPYYMNINDNPQANREATKWCIDADVCIIGCGNCDDYIKLRMKTNKLTFKLKERIFKRGISPTAKAYYDKKINEYFRPYIDNNLFYLCMGHYAAHDLYSIGVPQHKLIKWGYFVYKSEFTERTYTQEISLLWAGRFIPEKRPEAALLALKTLLNQDIKAYLHYIGYGPEKERIMKYVYESNLNQYVCFHGEKTEWEVRKMMRESNWFLFTSTGWEGWGVVLSEAMLEGMICLATRCAGSSKELIVDNYNGILLNSDLSDISEKVLSLANKGFKYCKDLGTNAKRYMEEEFDPANSANRLMALIEHFYKYDYSTPFKKGICSLARINDYDE